MDDSKWDDSNGLEFYKNTVRLTLQELEKQQRKHLLRLRRAGFSQNSSTPDCGHHGDNSFQEDHFSGIPTTLCINIAIFCIIIVGKVLSFNISANISTNTRRRRPKNSSESLFFVLNHMIKNSEF